MKTKRILSTFCAIMFCMLAVLSIDTQKVHAAPFETITYYTELKVGEKSQGYHPSMTDWFKSYSITDSSVADIEYTDPNLIFINGKKPGTSVVTIYGEYRDYVINVTVIDK